MHLCDFEDVNQKIIYIIINLHVACHACIYFSVRANKGKFESVWNFSLLLVTTIYSIKSAQFCFKSNLIIIAYCYNAVELLLLI